VPYGFAGHIGVAKETTWGTPVAVASGDFIDAMTEGLATVIDRFDVRNIYGRFAEPDDFAGLKHYEGDVVLPGMAIGLGHVYNGVFGQGSKTITVILSGFLWTTEFWPSPSDFSSLAPVPPYTVEINRDVTSAYRYSGAQFAHVTQHIQPNQDLRMTAHILAKTSSIIAKSTVTYPTSPADPFTFDTASIAIGGVGTDLVEALSIEFDNQLVGIPALNVSTEIARVRRRGFQLVRLSGTLAFDNLTEYNNFYNQTEQALTLSLFKAQSFQVIYTLPRFVYHAFPATMPGRDRLHVAFSGLARFHVGSGTAISVKLTTVRSNY
jgi:hypothetical protein